METVEYEIMYRVEETHWWYGALHRLIMDRLNARVPDWQNKAILDAGCGTGAILKRLGCMPRHVGVDLSPHALEFCAKRQLSTLVRADIRRLPFAPATFDAVVCSSVLYHQWISEVDGTLNELWKVLKPGGYLFVNVPAFPSLHSEHDDKVFTARRFRRGQFTRTLSKCNFEVIECVYWTSLLFPFIWMARRFGFVRDGRDFDISARSHPAQAFFDNVMKVEAALSNYVRFPAGSSLFAVAKKPAPAH